MEITQTNWPVITRLFSHAAQSSFHCSMATTTTEGTPHISPIGSLLLTGYKTGFYFEHFPVILAGNISHANDRVCVMAVNSNKIFWLKTLISGQFHSLPGIRLYGTASRKRRGSETEKAMWENRVRSVKYLKGHQGLWGNLTHGRDILFDAFEPVLCGAMTADALKAVV